MRWCPRITVALLVALPTAAAAETIFEQRSLYRNITVTELKDVRCLKFATRRYLDVRQSCMDLTEPDTLIFDYTRMVLTGLFVQQQPQDALVLGLGGGTIPRALAFLYPDIQVTSVEIDPAVVSVAERYFDFTEDEQQTIHVADGRVWVKRALQRDERFDYIVLDAFNGDYIPEHMLTREFLLEVRDLLRPGGVVVANTFSVSRLYHSESMTYLASFDWVINVERDRGNRILVAGMGSRPSDEALLAGALRLEAEHDLGTLGLSIDELIDLIDDDPHWDPAAPILTDEYSPANLMNVEGS